MIQDKNQEGKFFLQMKVTQSNQDIIHKIVIE